MLAIYSQSKILCTMQEWNPSNAITCAAVGIVASAAIAAGVIALLQIYQVSHITLSPFNSFGNMGVVWASVCIGGGTTLLAIDCALIAIITRRHLAANSDGNSFLSKAIWSSVNIDPLLEDIAVDTFSSPSTELIPSEALPVTFNGRSYRIQEGGYLEGRPNASNIKHMGCTLAPFIHLKKDEIHLLELEECVIKFSIDDEGLILLTFFEKDDPALKNLKTTPQEISDQFIRSLHCCETYLTTNDYYVLKFKADNEHPNKEINTYHTPAFCFYRDSISNELHILSTSSFENSKHYLEVNFLHNRIDLASLGLTINRSLTEDEIKSRIQLEDSTLQDIVSFATWHLQEDGQCWVHSFPNTQFSMVISKVNGSYKVAYFDSILDKKDYITSQGLKDISFEWYDPGTSYTLSKSELDWILWMTPDPYCLIEISNLPEGICYEFSHALFSIFYKKGLNNNQPLIVTKFNEIESLGKNLNSQPFSISLDIFFMDDSDFFKELDIASMEEKTFYLVEGANFCKAYLKDNGRIIIARSKFDMAMQRINAMGWQRLYPPENPT